MKSIKSFLFCIIFLIVASMPANAAWTETQIDSGFSLGANTIDYADLAVFNDKLYAGIGISDDTFKLYEYVSGTTWTEVDISTITADTNNTAVYPVTVFNNELILVGENDTTGVEIWTWDGSSTFTQINTDGFGDVSQTALDGATHIAVFNNKLYVGVADTNGENARVYEYSGSGTTWTNITESLDTMHPPHLIVHNNMLYGAPGHDTTGVEVWEYSGSGTTWTQVNADGFGASTATRGVLASWETLCMLEQKTP